MTALDPDSAHLLHLDCFRRSSAKLGAPADHKEWQHFVVHTPELHLLLNFSLLDDAWAAAPTEVGRLVCLAHRGRWIGGADRFSSDVVQVPAGGLLARFGPNEMSFVDGSYRVRAALRDGSIEADLLLRPTSMPYATCNQALSDRRSLSWCFVPRLSASGHVRVEGQTVQLDGAIAYHDHNWGRFQWGDDFCWDWTSVLPGSPEVPFSVVALRLTDRRRHLVRSQAFFLYEGQRPLRFFRDSEIEYRFIGRLRKPARLRVPPVMAMLAGGQASEVPAAVEVTVHSLGDSLRMRFEAQDVAQVILPNETDVSGITVLNEVIGRASLEGQVTGRSVAMHGDGIFEFIHG